MTNSFRWKASAPKHRAATRKWYKNNRKDAREYNKLYAEKKRIEKQYDEWNDKGVSIGNEY